MAGCAAGAGVPELDVEESPELLSALEDDAESEDEPSPWESEDEVSALLVAEVDPLWESVE